MKHAPRPPRGFTLVELLVVIGIIALLIGILMPALAKAREQANAVKCMSNQRQIGQALVMFTNEHKGFLPKAWFNDGVIWSVNNGGKTTWEYRDPMFGWTYVLSLYMGRQKESFRCPGDDTNHFYDTFNNTMSGLSDDPTADDIPGSYRLNISNLPNGPFEAIKVTRLASPTASIVIADGAQGAGQPWNQLATWEVPDGHVSKRDTDNVAFRRHRGRGMYVFADGHAENLLWDETWAPRGEPIPGANGSRPTMWRMNYEGASKGWQDRP
jgi:prepilin-type N-terminal cleavage/methylation domain-containing protein/prepilin-type processing-associated H-X9-DG protein